MNGLLELGDFKAGDSVFVDVWFSKNVDVYGFRVAGLRQSVWDQVAAKANGLRCDGRRLYAVGYGAGRKKKGSGSFCRLEYQQGMTAWL